MRACGDEVFGARELHHVEGARAFGDGEVEVGEADEEDDAAEREVDGDFPRRSLPLAISPNADEQEGGDEGQLVEGVEEEKVLRRKRARRARGDEEDTGIEKIRALLDVGPRLRFLPRRRLGRARSAATAA